MNELDYFWHSPDGWRYSRDGVKVGPFDGFADAVEDYYEPELRLLPAVTAGVGINQGVATLLTD